MYTSFLKASSVRKHDDEVNHFLDVSENFEYYN